MTEDTARRIGAVLGLSTGIVAMNVLGYSGVAWGALFGAGGCVTGSILAEYLHAAWIKSKEN